MPVISVVMAAFNAENYIEDSINSILNQDFRNIELIICDDASTDLTWEKIKKAMQKDNRIVGIKNASNLKAAATRNKCIDIAKGDYIAIQDSDDISEPNRLTKQLCFLEKNTEVSFVSTAMYLFDQHGKWNSTKPVHFPMKHDFLKGTPFAHGPTLFRIGAMMKVSGYRVAKETQRGQDADLFMRLYSKGHVGANITQELYGYRVDEKALGRRSFKYRYHGVLNRYVNFKEMGLMPLGYFFMFKPIVGWFVPQKLLYKIRKKLNE